MKVAPKPPLQTSKFQNHIVNDDILMLIRIAREDNLSALTVLQGGVFNLSMPLKLCPAAQVDTCRIREQSV